MKQLTKLLSMKLRGQREGKATRQAAFVVNGGSVHGNRSMEPLVPGSRNQYRQAALCRDQLQGGSGNRKELRRISPGYGWLCGPMHPKATGVGDVNEQSRMGIDMDAVIFSLDTMDGLLHALMVRGIIRRRAASLAGCCQHWEWRGFSGQRSCIPCAIRIHRASARP